MLAFSQAEINKEKMLYDECTQHHSYFFSTMGNASIFARCGDLHTIIEENISHIPWSGGRFTGAIVSLSIVEILSCKSATRKPKENGRN